MAALGVACGSQLRAEPPSYPIPVGTATPQTVQRVESALPAEAVFLVSFPEPTPSPAPERRVVAVVVAQHVAYGEDVERWRQLVARYFAPGDVGKALWVVGWETGWTGNPLASGDNGCSVGLFQLNCHGLGAGMSVEARQDPETNIRTAAAAVYGGSGWRPWGEGALHNGLPFGALGHHPYPGD